MPPKQRKPADVQTTIWPDQSVHAPGSMPAFAVPSLDVVEPLSHRDDPSTSREAAAKVAPTLSAILLEILGVFAAGAELTAWQAALALDADPPLEFVYTVRRRCSDLIRIGRLERTGARRQNGLGNNECVLRARR